MPAVEDHQKKTGAERRSAKHRVGARRSRKHKYLEWFHQAREDLEKKIVEARDRAADIEPSAISREIKPMRSGRRE